VSLSEDDLVASTLTITGTHRGKFRSIEPTGKSVNFTGVHIERVRNGRILEMWHRPDFLRLLMQIGAVSEDIMAS
jgi:predicted ester cyclase